MKRYIPALVLFLCLLNHLASAKKTELYSSKYFTFQSSQSLNAHLFLYEKAARCKADHVHNDSLAYYCFKDKWTGFSTADRAILNATLRFYKDSLLTHDLLSDSSMRHFEDYLSSENSARGKCKLWQIPAFEALRIFQPCFVKFYWPAIDSANKAWLVAHKSEVTALESSLIPELEKIYRTRLSETKIRIDLCCYAAPAGACSYQESYPHVIFSTRYEANSGALAAEMVFHETSHFLSDKLKEQIALAVKAKNLKNDPTLWHAVIFYTSGIVMEKEYRLKWQKYEPYYLQMKFAEKFPDLQTGIAACRLFWEPYLNGEQSFELAVANLAAYTGDKR